MPLLTDASWLHSRLSDVTLIDATTIFDPAEPDNRVQARKSRDAYEAGHIPGAVHADLMYALARQDTHLHCMALDSVDFQSEARKLGISDDSHIVIYDQGTMMWATRLWWNLRLEGHSNVSVFDGGLPAWRERGYPVETGTVTAVPGDFTACRRPELYATVDDVAAAIDDPSTILINALDRDSYIKAHIPGSVNVPCAEAVDAAAFEAVGALDEGKRVITYCGGGIAATFDAFQLARLGRDDVRVYDGSMTDWTSDPSRPLEHGTD
ncbi:sulfurtransferase [Corynebacterium cystitidis]|uniref:Thiosulfate/3-mercaptopyruvate sulfurtransferase n=1 Tax=Corynebacterium cystitidis DSM 20524 TaxID=1121357 RepID=A0A1H9QQA0_9CORY|nr:sulfurtransferase [Corynebacterium cystitidis]WJY81695.1 3-mercaptopyruvate sulfurtransferase [Corynebacterium cystitidis DSM 20524]SER62761.1 thiosulfate/3-mercaptopyruvate sulfurtransferase [Corynebacterium cystitidis DSM 20524]SNV84789.1 thiosulfate sulfurtransferase [Corynebacterium cystitidis]